ncbi:hypothetical protein K503DRAFT_867926 [Rhizopogon vinicolor AM-OR11-026]|uniref:F-box domain-containing protein n=1 Tax=Rhizopogon vinicolor AM-OR11-026 TaxID=1314800 RepID=A0A1B7MTL8_9AGAM|nr:hypothetical protein K503DRAFT_867926 [Rhizopogon vinicolor AM-OR11-026]
MSTDIEYIYEIDLDRKIFHINGIPLFALECLLSDEVFLKHVSEDHYRNVACIPECPPEHMYKRPTPPVVEDSEFSTYRSLVCIGTDVALSDLLGISDVLSPCEHIRASLLETIIGQCMARTTRNSCITKHDVRRTAVATFYQFILVSDHNQLTDQEWSTASFMANLAFIPQIFDSPTWPWTRSNHQSSSRKEFTWIREDTVLCIATHLDDERCLFASISRLIDEILAQKDNPGDYFGVAFSISHCAIVKVVKYTHAATFGHTGALQFLPSFFADSPSTPGITALARLGYRVDPALFMRAMRVYRYQPKKRHTDDPPRKICSSAVLPPELWREIGFLLQLHDLFAFGLVSKLCHGVASMVLCYPHICGYRLIDVPKEQPRYLQSDCRFLHAVPFLTSRDGFPAIMIAGLGDWLNIIEIPSDFDDSSLTVCFSVRLDDNLIGTPDINIGWGISD